VASRDSVRTWVYGILNIFPSYLTAPARWVADRLFGTWDEIYQFFIHVRGSFTYLSDRSVRFVNALWRFINECATTVRWMVSLFVPKWARWALNLALDTLRGELSSARAFLQGLIDDARALAQRLVNTVSTWAQSWFDWFLARLRETIATLTAVRDRVVQLLTDPGAFVDWVFDALWRRFWKFANDHAEAIAAAYWPRRDDLLVKTLTRIENFLMRVL